MFQTKRSHYNADINLTQKAGVHILRDIASFKERETLRVPKHLADNILLKATLNGQRNGGVLVNKGSKKIPIFIKWAGQIDGGGRKRNKLLGIKVL